MKVGLIGLGNMGSGMAANLLKGGHDVTVYNRTPSKAQALLAQGAHYAAQVGEACRGDAVITMLADDGAVEGVVFGDAGEGGVVKSMARRNPHFLEHHQRGAFGKDGCSARGERPAFCLSSCFRTARGGGCGQALHCRGRRAGCGGNLHAFV